MNDAKNETVTPVSELKPCPFCGAPGVLVQVPAEFGPRYRVDCSRACESARLVGNAFAAIEAWNRRSALSPSPAPVTPVSELKPCPFCDVPPLAGKDATPIVPLFIKCHVCPVVMRGQTADEVRDQWNRRSALADVGECETCKGVGRTPALLGRILGKCVTCNGTGKQPRPAAEAVCTHCMFTPEERAHPEHYNVRPCRYCSPAAEAK